MNYHPYTTSSMTLYDGSTLYPVPPLLIFFPLLEIFESYLPFYNQLFILVSLLLMSFPFILGSTYVGGSLGPFYAIPLCPFASYPFDPYPLSLQSPSQSLPYPLPPFPSIPFLNPILSPFYPFHLSIFYIPKNPSY